MNNRHVLLLVLVVFAVTCFGQGSRGTLTGLVTDSSGAVVPTVQLAVTNIDTGAEFKAITTAAGEYTLPNLPPGPYKVVFETTGFKKVERLGLQLSPGQVLRVDIVLQVGAVTETLEVTAAPSRVETETAKVAIDMNNTTIRDMPISLTNLTVSDWVATISPGIAGSTYNPIVNGVSQHNTNLALIDGMPAGASEQNSWQSDSPGSLAIAETTVQSAGYSAEYGRLSAGVYNYVMKSGTNQMHGSAYLGGRNEALEANTFVNNFNGLPRNKDRQQRWAFAGGGPVYIPKVYNGKNKAFWFFSYDRYRNDTRPNPSANASYPIPDFYAGNFSRLESDTGYKQVGTDALGNAVIQGEIFDPATIQLLPNGSYVASGFPGNIIPASRFSKVSQTIAQIGLAHYMPTYKQANGLYPLTQNAWNGGPTTSNQINFGFKVDLNLSIKHKLALAWDRSSNPNTGDRGSMFDPNDPPSGGPFAEQFEQSYTHTRPRITEDWTISPRVFNHIGITYNRAVNNVADPNIGIDGAAAYGISNLKLNDYPSISWGSGPVYSLANPTPFSLQGISSPWFETYTTWAWQDNVSWSKGRHFFKVGYDEWHWFYDGPTGPGAVGFNFTANETGIPNAPGSISAFTGYSFASFLLGMVNSASLTPPSPIRPNGLYHGAFIQDDFKARANLTLNLGLRYDYNPLSTEEHDRIDSWEPTANDPLVNLPGAYEFAGNCSGCAGKRNFGQRDFKDFGPRIGFAWQPIKNFTVRGAYTITYLGDDTGTALGGTPGFTTGGLGPNIVGSGSYNLAANPLYPWQPLFNWDSGFPTNAYVPPVNNPSYADTIGTAYMVSPRYGITPYLQQWNFTLQRQLPGRVLIDAGYIGNKGTRMRYQALENINQTPVSDIAAYGANLAKTITSAAQAATYGAPYPYAGFSGTVNSALRQFPQLRGNSTIASVSADDGFSTYESFNLVVNRQFYQGLSVYGNWVWSKSIDNMGGTLMDYYNRGLEKLIDPNDKPNVVKIFVQYSVPLGRGKRFGAGMPKALDWVVGGWEVSGIANYSSGSPLTFSGGTSITGWNGGANRINALPGDPGLTLVRKNYDYADRLSDPALDHYFNTSLYSQPASLTLGTAAPRYTYLRGWGTRSENIGLRKYFRVKEKYAAQVRADILNALNRVTLPNPTTNITSPFFGYITGSPSGNRVIELSLRFDF